MSVTPGIPDGWFAVAWSADLPEGGVEPLRVLGRELVLYRGDDGVARILDAHCRHLGAHLGYGGRVEGEGLRCPFHGWRWEPDGRCGDVPYSKRIPVGAKIAAWGACERNATVYVWHGLDGEAAAPEPSGLEELDSDAWIATLRRRWKSRAGLSDAAELGFDLWRGETPELHVEDLVAEPGSVQLLRASGATDAVAALHRTPIDAETLDVRLEVARPRDEAAPRGREAERFERDLIARIERDLALLAAKATLDRPLLVPEDGDVAGLRRRVQS